MYIFASISKYKWKIKILRMKKLYSFLASTLVAVGVNAAMPAKVAADKVGSVAQGDITNVTPLKVNMTKAEGMQVKKHTSVNPLIFKEKKGAAKVLSNDGWETLGEADFYDAITVTPLSDWGVERAVYKVEIQESQEQPGVYRLINIHANNPYIGEDMCSLADPDGDSYMIIDTTNPDMGPYMQVCNFNLLSPTKEEENECIVEQINFGSFEDGVIILPKGSICIGLGASAQAYITWDDEGNIIIPEEYKESAFLTNEDLVIVLPGATYDPNAEPEPELDYSFNMIGQTDICASDNNQILWGFEGGADIKSYKYGFFEGKFRASEDNLAFVAQNGNDINADSYLSTLPGAGWYSIFVVGLNEAGERVAGDVRYYYAFAHNPEEWTSIGHVMFTDDTFGPLYGLDDEVAPVKVEVLESKTKSGLYRLVNPYATHALADENPDAIICVTDPNHYLDIDASDAENVTISEVPIGVSVLREPVSVFSIENGTLVDNKISFPVRGLGVGIYGEQEYGTAFYANLNGRFTVELPCTLKVHALDAEGNPVEEAYIYAGNEEAVTNANGDAEIELFGVIGTTVPVSATKDYMFWEGEADFTESAVAYVFPELKEPACTLKVSVCDAEGEPVEGATVYVNGTEEITPENGTVAFTLEGVMGTKVALSAYKDYMFWEGEADFTESMEAWVIAELKEPACTLTVKAINADYEPIAGAIVNVKGEEKETDETGTVVFTLEGVMGTQVAVSAYKDYMYWEGVADFTEGMEAWVFAELKNPDCTLSVKVVDVDYEPVADAIVIANGVEATTAENGSANLEVGDVLGTVVTVKVTKDGYKDAEVEADFTETMEANVVVTLTKSTTVGLSLAIIDANKNIKVYDLQGRRVEHPSVGNIYIVDGKKVRIIE